MNKEVLFVRDIPGDLKKDFKVACATKGVTMREVVIKMIKRYVKTAKP